MFYGECNVLIFTFQDLPLIAHEANSDNLIDNVQYTPEKKD